MAEVRTGVLTEVRAEIRAGVRTEVRTVAVIGAGIMGRGIAHAAALGGYRTILEDLLPNALRKAETEIRSNLDKAVELGKVNASEADAAFSRLEYAGSVDEAARDADLIIEAVPEEMESKIEIFTMLDKICRPTTILASNTSSLSVTEIASVYSTVRNSMSRNWFERIPYVVEPIFAATLMSRDVGSQSPPAITEMPRGTTKHRMIWRRAASHSQIPNSS